MQNSFERGKIKQWHLLKENKCPLCRGDMWIDEEHPNMYKCTRKGCTFLISEKKFKEIVGDRVKKQIEVKHMSEAVASEGTS